MEDDDEFGDLYTDVLSSFPSSSSAPPPAPSPAPPVSVLPPPSPIPNPNNYNSGSAAALDTPEDVGIPGLGIDTSAASSPPVVGPSSAQQQQGGGSGGGGGWESESDSDSEDDLQIVLNDNVNNPMDPNSMIIRDDDEDGDDDSFVIVADHSQQLPLQPGSEEPDCGDEAGEAKDNNNNNNSGMSTNVAVPGPHKFGNYGFPHFNSQFKYVRPGAQPLAPGPGGAPGQVRPPINMTNMAGRGRGDWRPPGMKGPLMQKGFHPGFWGNNAPGRGLDFTLPSHKNIFDVDIDSFEEKPWKYPGIDMSDFFNFNLNEESWKEYCKQLEQLRLESTMQSKIRVYESGRTEQEYDPDLPPELAAAAGIHDSSAENIDNAKADGFGDSAKGSARTRPPLPTGRAIQVETGFGERLPSVDTRPPRIRDSDAVIEIVLQDSVDDVSAENDAIEHSDDDVDRENDQVDVVDEDGPQDDDEVFDSYPRESTATKDLASKSSPLKDSSNTNIHDEEGDGSSPQRALSDDHPSSEDHAPSENIGSPFEEERLTKTTACERSSHMSSSKGSLDRKSLGCQREDSVESVERKHFQESSGVSAEEAQASLDGKAAIGDDLPSEVKSRKGKDADDVGSTVKTKNKHRLHSSKQRKVDSRVESSANKDIDYGGEIKASKSSENSKAAGSSRDNQKWLEGIDEEAVQNGHSIIMGEVKRRYGEVGHDSRRKDHDGRMDMVGNHFSAKGKEDYYSHKDWDPYATNQFHVKPEAGSRRRDRDYSDVSWQRRDEDHFGRRIRAEDGRKQERGDDMVSRQRSKGREINRDEKDEYLASRKLLDNGNWRGYHDKDRGPRYREKDDGLKSRHEILDDHHGKRRKEDEHPRRDHVDKEGILLGHRESSSTRGKRERDGFLDHRKRDDTPRIRDKSDDHAIRHKDEVWMQRERVDQRDRDERYHAKSSYEDNMSRRERDGRAPNRSSRVIDENLWVGNSRGREEYKGPEKDAARHNEQVKKRAQVEEEISLQRGSEDANLRGNQFVSEGKRPRQERSSVRNERALNAPDSHKFHEKKHKDNLKKARELEGHSTSAPSKRHQVEKGISNDVADVKNVSVAEHNISSRQFSREGRKDISSDDEQHDSKRGRSKLERWTSHKDREYDVNSKSSAALKIKDAGKDRIAESGPSIGVRDESTKNVEAEAANQTLGTCNESGGSEEKDLDPKPADDRHLDTVEKLKRRSERFKLPLASEKEPQTIKKTETETLPSSQSETPANAEVKQERPPRKRRWISS